MRELLRSLPVLTGPLPGFDVDRAPEAPSALFAEWLGAAVDAGVSEPHAVTLSTVDGDGWPDARVLILKDVDERGWWFASSASSAKGQQLATAPRAALSAYWPALGRQVRIRGEVAPASAQDSARDFLARSPGARAESLLGRQSEVLSSAADLEAPSARAAARVAAQPKTIAPTWTLYGLRAREVEFWQGSGSRRHTRLRYRRIGQERWRRELLWP